MSQIRTIKFADSEAKGRNGYFRLAEADVWRHDGKVRIELFSKVRGDSPPVVVELTPADLDRLFSAAAAVASERTSS